MKKKFFAIVLAITLLLSGMLYNTYLGMDSVNAEVTTLEVDNNLINYVVVNSPTLSLDETQVVVIGIGNSDLALKDSLLFFKNNTTGEEYCVPASQKTEDSFQYEINFNGCKEGEYCLTYLQYKVGDEEHVIELENAGIEAKWGVGVVVDTDNDDVIEKTNSEASENSQDNDVVYTVQSKDGSYNATKLSEAINKVTESNRSKFNADGSYKGSGANGELIVCIDPGHGGSDSGACANGIIEKNHNLLIATICQMELQKYGGVCVFKTRDDDSYVGLEDRTNIAAFWHSDVFVSIHLNSAGENASGAEVYYPNESYNSAASYAGYNVSTAILNNLTSLGLVNRGVKIRNGAQSYPDGSVADYYSVIRNCKLRGIPGIIVEHAFITNPFEAMCLQDGNFVYSLGEADARGIAQAYHLGGAWRATGLYVHEHRCDNITVGLCVDNKNTDLDYRWMAYDCATGQWKLISDWTTNNPWLMWNPGKTGDYLIHGEVRQTNNQSICNSFDMGFHHNQYINSICAMPNPNGYGILLGEQTQYASSNYRYEIMILDCNKYMWGDPNPWVYSSGRNSANQTFWTVANVPNGYFWTLYRVYDAAGNQLDEQCWGFSY